MKHTSLIIIALIASAISVNAQDNAKDSTMAKISTLESIEKGVTNGYLLIENGVVKGYKAIETGTVEGFTRINDDLTIKLFGRKGETLEETKARLKSKMDAAEERTRKAQRKNQK